MNWIDEVKAQVSVLEVAARFTALKQSGGGWRGPCPLHGGKGQNFTVYPDRGTYHCFVCKATGDVFTLLRELEGLEFLEAAERLAGELNIPVVRGVRRGTPAPSGGQDDRAALQKRFGLEGGAWWNNHVGELATRVWGLGVRRAGDSVVGTVPLFRAGGRQVVGWMCYGEGEEGELVRLGLAPESDATAVDGVAIPSDVAKGVSRSGVVGVFGDPLEAVVAWGAGGRGVVGVTRDLGAWVLTVDGMAAWWHEIGAEAVWWGLSLTAPGVLAQAFQLEVPCVEHGFACLVAAGPLAERNARDLAIGMGEALEHYEAALDAPGAPLVADTFQQRCDLLRRRHPRGPLPPALLVEKLGPTIRAAGRLADRRLFYAYSRWAFRESGCRDFNQFLGDVTRGG